eukprot:7639395-Alexandrium_andersonii.AAC.1
MAQPGRRTPGLRWRSAWRSPPPHRWAPPPTACWPSFRSYTALGPSSGCATCSLGRRPGRTPTASRGTRAR